MKKTVLKSSLWSVNDAAKNSSQNE